jgi:biopolymer transport protein ExbB
MHSALLWRSLTRGLVGGLLLCLMLSASQVRGQDDGAGEFAGEATPAAAQPGPAPGPVAPVQPPNDTAAPSNLLVWTVRSLGPLYTVVFLLISFVFVSLLVMCILQARRDNICPAELVQNFEQKLTEKDFQQAYELARSDESVLGQVLSAGLARLSRGYGKAVEAMQEVGMEESLKLEHRLSYLALIGSISPMVGLLGTVQGMIASFQVIASSSATPKPSELAGGISTALFTTLVGLLIAIPALTAYNILRNIVTQRMMEVGITSENLMNRFEDVQPRKTPA